MANGRLALFLLGLSTGVGIVNGGGVRAPNQFTFVDDTNAATSTLYTSAPIVLAGGAGNMAVSVTGGEWNKNGGAFQSTAGTANNGDSITVRGTSSVSLNTGVDVTLTVQGVSDTYTITTTAQSRAAGVMARMTNQPNQARRDKIVNFASALTLGANSGTDIYAKLDLIYVLSADDVQQASLNWPNATYNLTAQSSPTFTANVGVKGDGASSYFDSGFNLNTATSPKYTQNSACGGGWCNDVAEINQSSLGAFIPTSPGGLLIGPRIATNIFAIRINHVTQTSTTSITDGSGLSMANRTASGATQSYKNGSNVNNGTATSNGPPNMTFRIGSGGSGIFGTQTWRFAFVGGSLNANEHLDLYNACVAYLA